MPLREAVFIAVHAAAGLMSVARDTTAVPRPCSRRKPPSTRLRCTMGRPVPQPISRAKRDEGGEEEEEEEEEEGVKEEKERGRSRESVEEEEGVFAWLIHTLVSNYILGCCTGSGSGSSSSSGECVSHF